MHIIFGNVGYWQVFLAKILSYFKFKVFYLYIDAKSNIKKNTIATKLKRNNIFPLPIEFQEKYSPKAPNSISDRDPDEAAYKKNMKLVPEEILKKYCNLFSIDETKVKKLRLLLQDIVSSQQITVSGRLGMWAALYPSKKIIFVSFKFINFYGPDIGSNITKIIIPLDIFNFFIKIFKKIFSFPSRFINKNNIEEKNEALKNKNFHEFEKQKVALIIHKGIYYGKSKNNLLFEKSLYYSDDIKSCLNKYNLLHLDYSNYPNPDKNINWVCIKKINISNSKVFFKTLLASLKTFYLIRNWSTFLGWVLCIQQYTSYAKYCEAIKKFKNLKIAIIDYDYLCSKPLILALKKNNIKTIATQERFITIFYNSFANVILDAYYTASEYSAKVIKKSKYCDIINIIPVGQYRSDYLQFYKKQAAPKEIFNAKKNGKKILIAFAQHPSKHWFESYTSPVTNWSAQIDFLEDMIRLSQNLKNTFIVLRYKFLEWQDNEYFKKILKKIHDCENIIISDNYKESCYSYKLCANADLVIAKHTSIADECLSKEIPVLFHEYTHNTEDILLNIPNYLPLELICHNFEELYQKSESILASNSNKWEEKIKELNKKIYYVKEKKNIKAKILNDLENQIVKMNF